MEPSLPYSKALDLAVAISDRFDYEGHEEGMATLIELLQGETSVDEFIAESERIKKAWREEKRQASP